MGIHAQRLNVWQRLRLASGYRPLTISVARTDMALLTRRAVRLAAALPDSLFEHPAMRFIIA